MVEPDLTPLAVIVDPGPVGQGASQARYFQAANGTEYVVKSPELSPNNPYVGANELIAADLGFSLGLPTLEWRLLSFNDNVYFGSPKADDIAPIFDVDILNNLRNFDSIYDLAVFDVWLMNIDRGDHNIRARKVQNEPDEYLLLILDHSHAILPPNSDPQDLVTLGDIFQPNFVRSTTIRNALTDGALLDEAGERILNAHPEIIESAVNKVPQDWLTDDQKQQVIQCLDERRINIKSLLNHLSSVLPKLS